MTDSKKEETSNIENSSDSKKEETSDVSNNKSSNNKKEETSVLDKIQKIINYSEYRKFIDNMKVVDVGYLDNEDNLDNSIALMLSLPKAVDVTKNKLLISPIESKDDTYIFKIPSQFGLFYSFRNRIDNSAIEETSLLVGNDKKTLSILRKHQIEDKGEIRFSLYPIPLYSNIPLFISVKFNSKYKLTDAKYNRVLATLGQSSETTFRKLIDMFFHIDQ